MPTTTTSRRRHGFALVLAVAAMALLGALIAGVFFVATQEARLGRNALLQTRALTAAELGLHAVVTPAPVGSWNPGVFSTLAPGATAPVLEFLPGDGSVDSVRITRLNDDDFLIVSEGRAGSSRGARARRRIASVITMRIPRIAPTGVLTARGPVDIADSASIDGSDGPMLGRSCAPSSAPIAGVVTDDSAHVNTTGCTSGNCLMGSPPIVVSAAAADTSTYTNYGGADWRGLVGQADKIAAFTSVAAIGPSYNGDGTCNTADALNWGDPGRTSGNPSCQAYHPIIYAPADLQLSAGAGQGILLVAGDLELSGGATFFGLIIVGGRLSMIGAGSRLIGTVMAANGAMSRHRLTGNSAIRYSSCATAAALAGSARRPTSYRGSWNELY